VRTLALAIVAITNSPCHQDTDSFATISRIDIMGSGTRGQTCLSTARLYEPLAEFLSQHDTHERCGLLAARYAFSGKSVVPELILFDGWVPVDIHGAGGGRN
jgi:hypothetical protein